MISCNKFSSLDKCVDYIIQISQNDDLYMNILKNAPVTLDQWHHLMGVDAYRKYASTDTEGLGT